MIASNIIQLKINSQYIKGLLWFPGSNAIDVHDNQDRRFDNLSETWNTLQRD